MHGDERDAIAASVTLLVRHPDTPPGAIQLVDAELRRVPGGAVATYRAIGDISRLDIPPPASPERTDELWNATCFELFVGGEGSRYREYNLSPSGVWAAYEFDDYRFGRTDVPVRIEVEILRNPKCLTLIAKVESEFSVPANVGMTAVIKETDGVIRYWSTVFAPGKPDFHADAVRSLLFDAVGTE